MLSLFYFKYCSLKCERIIQQQQYNIYKNVDNFTVIVYDIYATKEGTLIIMVTQLGKVLRIIRINTGDSMRTMADKLNVSISYLSAIENGKRNVPSDFAERVSAKYTLSDKDKENLNNAISQTASKIKMDITELSEKQRKLIYALSKNQIDEETIDRLYEIVDKKGENK